jgi:ABC-type multidrug transport system fused ATPase/permease subunit
MHRKLRSRRLLASQTVNSSGTCHRSLRQRVSTSQLELSAIYLTAILYIRTVHKNSLSGGQRQRVAIARALLKNASILCLDEASAALDGASEHKVNDAIGKILQSRHTSCLIVAHRLSTIQSAGRVAVLDEGGIVEMGTYKELASREGSKFREVMGAQITAVEF